MALVSQRQKGGNARALWTLDVCIQAANLAKGFCGIPLAQAAFASVSILLTTIRVRFPYSAEANMRLTPPRTRFPTMRTT